MYYCFFSIHWQCRRQQLYTEHHTFRRRRFEVAYKEVTAATTLTKADYNVAYTGTADAIITLPTISSTAACEFIGRIYRVKNLTTFAVTVSAATGQTIRTETATGASSITVPAGYTVEIVNSGATTWNADFLRGRSTKSWLLTYVLNNTAGDWVESFDTKIDANKYSMSIIGHSLKNNSSTYTYLANSMGTTAFAPFNIFPSLTANKTWAISADYSDVNMVNEKNAISNRGTYTIYVLVTTTENNGTGQTLTYDMAGNSTGAATSAPVLK